MGFETLSEIARENRRLEEEARLRAPVDCPIDGTPLQVRADGVRNCPMGNYRWEPVLGGTVLDGPGVESAWVEL